MNWFFFLQCDDEGNSLPSIFYLGAAVAQLVEALRYKSEGRGFDSL
jgi:hypothetical protein